MNTGPVTATPSPPTPPGGAWDREEPERSTRFLELGALIALLWWLVESMLHAWVFDDLPLAATLLGEHDPNELWMRGLGAVLLIALGRAAGLSPADLTQFLHGLFSDFDGICERRRVEKIKTIGDAYMAIAGIGGQTGTPELAAAAIDMLELGARTMRPDGSPLRLRAGMHMGPLIGGVIGRTRYSLDVWGNTVNIASRLEGAAPPGTVLTSEAVRTCLEGKFSFVPRGPVALAGWGEMDRWVLGPRT